MAGRRTQLEWTEVAYRVLNNRAKDAGLLGADERLVYFPPNREDTNGPRVEVHNNHGKVPLTTHSFWLPHLLPNDTNRTAERLADEQARILYALNLKNRLVLATD